MDGRHPNNDKPRPKRRKAEDNPYILSESVDAYPKCKNLILLIIMNRL